MCAEAQSYEFKAEIKQLLDILVHSVYTSKDIFVRELVSNASDALEKVRFLKATGQPIVEPERELAIDIETRNDDGDPVLVIRDSGIGMTEEEVRTNIGTIAHSGASSFLEQASGEKKDLSLIGQFGVGFYSVFMAAKRVVVTSRSATPDAAAVVWESDGEGSYTLEAGPAEQPRGTAIEVHLRDEEKRFADPETVKAAVRRYSSFVPFPVRIDGEQVNRISALWREPATTVKKESYEEFYKYLTHDTAPPRTQVHLSVDAPLQFSALLFVPETSHEIAGFGQGKVTVQLYVKRVLIDAENEDLLPHYLRFVRGVVESQDLPLNVSRETLQENPLVRKIRDTLTRELIDRFTALAEKNPEEYAAFWGAFGRILKEGHADFAHRDKLVELLRFNASFHEDAGGLTSLAQYVERMPEEQKAIYYLSGTSREALQHDPRLELFRKKGLDVLYLYELADEFVLGGLGEYREKQLLSADQVKPSDLAGLGRKEEATGGEGDDGGTDAGGAKAAAERPSAASLERLVQRFREILGDRVLDVRTSERLVDSPACIVGDEAQLSGHMDKVMRLINKDQQLPRRVLELNPDHGLVRSLARLVERDNRDPFLDLACEQLFEGAMLVDGYLADPHRLVERMGAVLT